MSWEIERKYLVADRSCLDQLAGVAFRQGYIPTQDGGVVRVRIEGERAVLTLKGQTSGIARREYEYEIPAPRRREHPSDPVPATPYRKDALHLVLGGQGLVHRRILWRKRGVGARRSRAEQPGRSRGEATLGRRRSIRRSTLLQRQPRTQSLLQVAGRLDYQLMLRSLCHACASRHPESLIGGPCSDWIPACAGMTPGGAGGSRRVGPGEGKG